ncbi:hypothetical protein QAD02_009027 [Eretmocerus hayati]|uniref:Uncharacterized protein n=1 Tax=Eretmocerus hayati TaxID=131215 RepID=A0ACC2NCK1_9HYME|nr:hypothetical protein QAD02_009027 [Eretmocerus hayati]
MEKERKAILEMFCSSLHCEYASREILRVSKSYIHAQSIREEGNGYFRHPYHDNFTHELIFQKYCLSLALTEKNSEQQAEAYGNRSALLLHLTRYEDCMIDTKRAINMTKSSLLKCRLLCREVACLVALGSSDAEKTLQKAKLWMNRCENKKTAIEYVRNAEAIVKKSNGKPKERKFFHNKVVPVKHRINDFSNVTVLYNIKYGNHAVAMRDIQPGEVVFVEKPYVTCLYFQRAHFYCSHCFISSWTMIPCDECSWCMFCSEKCKTEAWEKYHSIECPAYGYFIKNNTDVDCIVQCSLRSVIIGVNEAGSIKNLQNILKATDKGKYPTKFFEDSELQNTSFTSLYSLSSETSVEEKYLSMFPDTTLRLLVALAKYTHFFGRKLNVTEILSFGTNEDVIFIGSLILKLMKISTVNGQSVVNRSIYSGLNGAPHPDLTYLSKGFSISILSSLINHSCNPNVSRCFTEDNNVVVYALQPIQKGSQIFDCYLDGFHGISNRMKLEGYHNTFYEIPKHVRGEILRKRHGVICDCDPCVKNWPPLKPVLKDLIKRKPESYHKKLFKEPLEMKLFKSNKKMINLAESSEDAEYNPSMVSNLSKSIQEALNSQLPPTSIITWELIITLKRVFDRLYGYRFFIPNDSDLY